MKTKKLIALTLFLSVFTISPDLKTPVVYAAGSEGAMSESEHSPANKEEGKDEKMKEEMEHKHHEGMHGMMMHDMKGWWIVIGVVMVIMMGAHVAVLF